MSFEDLQLVTPIMKALLECGHTAPTEIQAQAIPKILAGSDLIASAQTGTGKTAAFLLPILQRLSAAGSGSKRGPRALVLTPTRELAEQVAQAARVYGKYLGVRGACIVGGMPYQEQRRALSKAPDLIIATPGRLLDYLERGSINLSGLIVLVLDEADRMLDMGFIEDVERIAAASGAGRQTLLFAATFDRAVAKLAERILRNPERVEVTGVKTTHELTEQRLHMADNLEHKHRLLRHLAADRSLTKVIIFSATKRDAESLAQELRSQGHAAAALHGDMNQSARNRTMNSMRHGRIRLLVATDVASRGIDVAGISHIINFDLPRSAEDYVHRIGRTGRAGASGIAISFVLSREFDELSRIEKYIGETLSESVIPGLEPERSLSLMRRNNRGWRQPYHESGRSRLHQGEFDRKRNRLTAGDSGKRGWGSDGESKKVIVEYRNGRSSRTKWIS
ncbi:MAG: DEAD/DEAH box helicase [Pseudomonadota bacterium]